MNAPDGEGLLSKPYSAGADLARYGIGIIMGAAIAVAGGYAWALGGAVALIALGFLIGWREGVDGGLIRDLLMAYPDGRAVYVSDGRYHGEGIVTDRGNHYDSQLVVTGDGRLKIAVLIPNGNTWLYPIDNVEPIPLLTERWTRIALGRYVDEHGYAVLQSRVRA